MNRIQWLLAAFCVCISMHGAGQTNLIFPKGEVSTVNNHTGTVWLNELAAPDSVFSYGIAVASFAPGARLDWHVHPAGQILLITDGVGYYQERGRPIRIVRKGDVIRCSPGVEHWHGAAPGSGFTYIATTPAQKGKTIWKERVAEAEYRNGGQQSGAEAAVLEQQEIMNLSKVKWRWMADKNVDSLNGLFDERAVFVHMGGTWGKSNELDVIRSGRIWYKKAEVYSASVNVFGNTAILLNDIDLVAVVGGNEVVNAFMVTEVYIKGDGQWKMGSLTFSHLVRPVKLAH